MKKLILLLSLMALPAFGQRSVSVNAAGELVGTPSRGLFTINSNLLDEAISRDVLTNVNAGTARFAVSTNTGAGRFESTLAVIGSQTNASSLLVDGAVGIGGTLSLIGAQTNVSTLRVNGPVGFGSTLSIIGAQTNVNTLLVNGAVGFGSTLAVAGAITPSSTINFPDNIRQTFNPGANAAGINVGSAAAAPDTPSNGDLYYDTTLNTTRARNNGAWVSWGTGGGGGDDKISTNSGSGWGISLNLRTTINGSLMSTTTNLTHASANDFVLDGPRYARLSMQGNTTITIITPTSATDLGSVWTVRVLEANSTPRTLAWVNATFRGPTPALNTGTNVFYINWDGTNCWVDAGQLATSGSGDHFALTNAPTINSPTIIGSPTIAGYVPTTRTLTISGTANEVDVSGGTLDLSANRSWSASLPAIIDLGGKTSLEVPNSAAPATTIFGHIAGDNNAWASGRGAIQAYDGTANTWLIGTLTTDTPTDLQVPKFNAASGTITWENDNNSGAATAFNDFADPTAPGSVTLNAHQQTWTTTLDIAGTAILTMDQLDADRANSTTLFRLRDVDNGDAEAVYLDMIGDSGGGAAVDYSFSQTQFFSRLAAILGSTLHVTGAQTNESTLLVASSAGIGQNLSVAGNAGLSGGVLQTTVGGAVTANGTLEVTGAVTNRSTFLNAGAAGFGSTITLAGALILQTANDPDVTVEGSLTWDANGDWVRAFDGANQVAVARKIEAIHVTVVLPNDLADSERDAFWVWQNVSGMNFVVTGWDFKSDTDNTTLNIEEIDTDGANNATVDAVEIATDGTGLFYATDTTITAATIETGHLMVLDFDDTDTPGQVKGTIYGYYDANVN